MTTSQMRATKCPLTYCKSCCTNHGPLKKPNWKLFVFCKLCSVSSVTPRKWFPARRLQICNVVLWFMCAPLYFLVFCQNGFIFKPGVMAVWQNKLIPFAEKGRTDRGRRRIYQESNRIGGLYLAHRWIVVVNLVDYRECTFQKMYTLQNPFLPRFFYKMNK